MSQWAIWWIAKSRACTNSRIRSTNSCKHKAQYKKELGCPSQENEMSKYWKGNVPRLQLKPQGCGPHRQSLPGHAGGPSDSATLPVDADDPGLSLPVPMLWAEGQLPPWVTLWGFKDKELQAWKDPWLKREDEAWVGKQLPLRDTVWVSLQLGSDQCTTLVTWWTVYNISYPQLCLGGHVVLGIRLGALHSLGMALPGPNTCFSVWMNCQWLRDISDLFIGAIGSSKKKKKGSQLL